MRSAYTYLICGHYPLHDLYVCVRHFDVEQRSKELQIVQKLLSEERRMRQQQERLSKPHWRPREVVATAGEGQGKKVNTTCLLSKAGVVRKGAVASGLYSVPDKTTAVGGCKHTE